jgi:hypothetical protein
MKFSSIISLIASAIFVTTVFARVWDYAEGGQVRWSTNCNFNVSDIQTVFVPNNQCGRVCIDNWACTHFTASRTVCVLKRNLTGMTEVFSRTEICGFLSGRSNQSTETQKTLVKN